MKRWVAVVELIDKADKQSPEWNEEHGLTEARIRELFDENFGPELDETISYKIRTVVGPYGD